MNLNVECNLHDAWVAAAQGVNMTNILRKSIPDYVAKNGVGPSKKGHRQ
jgi:hypothetical protein